MFLYLHVFDWRSVQDAGRLEENSEALGREREDLVLQNGREPPKDTISRNREDFKK